MNYMNEFCSLGILLVVAIGVALGVLIGGVLLSCVAYYMKRYAAQYSTNSTIIQYETMKHPTLQYHSASE